MKYFAGIGARDTPIEVLEQMTDIGMGWTADGWTLRSGGAKGADSAFEEGAFNANCIDPGMCPTAEIFKANDCTTAAAILASMYHPNWNACSEYVRKLHGRNAQILLGRDLKTPVDLVICWTPNGFITGGTGQSIRMANGLSIPVLNLARDNILDWKELPVPYTPVRAI